MNFEILKSESFEVKNWTGGTTTQLFIYPKTADYLSRNFEFRLSTANVLVEKSDFTILPEVYRQLMILDGQISLKHDNQKPKILKKFDISKFEGRWKTTSIGTCTDFNLMTTNSIIGNLANASIPKNKNTDYLLNKANQWQFIYVYKGVLKISLENQDLQLNTGDLLVFKTPEDRALSLKAVENCELVFANIPSN